MQRPLKLAQKLRKSHLLFSTTFQFKNSRYPSSLDTVTSYSESLGRVSVSGQFGYRDPSELVELRFIFMKIDDEFIECHGLQ